MTTSRSSLDELARQVPPNGDDATTGLNPKALLEDAEQKIDQIELIGEEEAAGFRPPAVSQVSPAMRYLHASRTIHQLVTDRNSSRAYAEQVVESLLDYLLRVSELCGTPTHGCAWAY